MVRLARFSADAFVDAAIALVAEGGPSAASMAAIARKVGAPTGSIYHRFESRSAVLATAWIAAHGSLLAVLAPRLRAGRAREAALALLAWAKDDLRRARFLLLNESGSLFEDAPPPEPLRAEIRRQEDEMDAAFRAGLAVAAGGASDDEIAARARFLVFDAPISLLRPHLLAGGPIPAFVDRVVTETHAALPLAPPEVVASPGGRAA